MPSCPTPNRAMTPPACSASYSAPEYVRGPTTTYGARASRTADARSASASGARRHSRPDADAKQPSAFRYSDSVTRTLGLEFDMSLECSTDNGSACWRNAGLAHLFRSSARCEFQEGSASRRDSRLGFAEATIDAGLCVQSW